MFEQTLALLH